MSKQPSFGQWLPVSLMIGVLAAITVFAAMQLGGSEAFGWAGAAWVMFISWGLYFMAGAKNSRLHKYFFGLSGGILFGALTVVVSGALVTYVGDMFALPLTVFLAATSIVLLELTDWLELAPAYFFTYAGFFAYFFGGFAGANTDLYSAALYYWILTMIGLCLGILSAWLKSVIFQVERVPFDQRNTIFDKEN